MGYEKLSLGILIGFVSGMLLSGQNKTIEKKVEVLRPLAIYREHRNNDGFLDIVQKYGNGSEVVLYYYRNKQGKIEYSLKK